MPEFKPMMAVVPSKGLLHRECPVTVFSGIRLWCLTLIYFSYGLIIGTMALVVLPAEAASLHPENESAMLGSLLAAVGVSQLACPIAGHMSDRRTGPIMFRRGRPIMLFAVLASFAVSCMTLSSLAKQPVFYTLSLFLGMTCLNVVQSVQSGVVPDIIPTELESRASSIVAMNSLGGSVTGFLVSYAAAKLDFRTLYPLYVALLLITVGTELKTAQYLERYKMRNQNVEGSPASTVSSTRIGDNDDSPLSQGITFVPSTPTSTAAADQLILNSEFSLGPSAVEAAVPIEGAENNADGDMPDPFVGVEETEGAASNGSSEITISLQIDPKHHESANSPPNVVSSVLTPRTPSFDHGYSPFLLPQSDVMVNNQQDNKLSLVRTVYSLWSCFTADLTRDFFLVFVGRTFYYCSVSCQVFMMYFMRDLNGVTQISDQKAAVAMLALCAQLTAAATAYPVGQIMTKHPELTYQAVLTGACVIMAAAYFAFLAVPVLGLGVVGMLVVALWYGIGNGAFLSVDYALALATVPDRKHSARALGLWGVSGFIGATLGPLFGGLLLHHFGGTGRFAPTGEELYAFQGYLSLIVAGVCMTALSASCVLAINEPKRDGL